MECKLPEDSLLGKEGSLVHSPPNRILNCLPPGELSFRYSGNLPSNLYTGLFVGAEPHPMVNPLKSATLVSRNLATVSGAASYLATLVLSPITATCVLQCRQTH